VRVVLPVIPFDVAKISVVFPAEAASEDTVSTPAAVIVATLGSKELHVTELVRSLVTPLEYIPVALNCCCAVPTASVGVLGEMDMADSVVPLLPEPPHPETERSIRTDASSAIG
jgi:hypothetical protein